MRLFLAPFLALVVLLTGCRAESPDESDGPRTDAPAENDVIALVSESDVGGEVSPQAAPLDGPTAIADFSAQFDDARMGDSIAAALAGTAVPEDLAVVGAVVAIGCEPPTEVEIEIAAQQVLIRAEPVKSERHCLVPVTTVALVAVPAA